nr:hypothetical protein [Tanacetum cinerariifolium]
MDTLSLVSEYLKDLEECMDDGNSKIAKESKLFDALEHKSVVIEVYNQKITIFIKVPLRAFGEPFIREASRERCQKWDLWMMSALEESRGVNLAWIIADHLYKYASGTKENSVICAGHYVTRIASFLGYCVDDEIKKCSELIECLNMSWGDWKASLREIERGNVWKDSMMIRNNYMLEHSMPILHHLADQGNFAYPTYEPPNVPPYPYPYILYPYPHTHYPGP